MIRLNVSFDTIMEKIQEKILQIFQEGDLLSSSEIHKKIIDERVSLVTIKRTLTDLVKQGMLEKQGAGRSVVYRISPRGLFLKPFVAQSYLEKEPDIRKGKTNFSFGIFDMLDFDFFTHEEIDRLDRATRKFIENSIDSEGVFKREMERFIIEMSWKSSKIEGNTYTLLDTELLIREGIKSSKNTESETMMILNHKKALEFIFEDRNLWETISIAKIEMLHSILIRDLGVAKNLRKRPVGVTGTTYKPLDNEPQIKEVLESLIGLINKKSNPFEKALLAIIGTSYIQPFEDGNKRTGRLLGNAILLHHHLAPLSYRSVDEVEYRATCLVFYEQNSIEPFKKIFVEQYIFACENYNIGQ